MRNAEREVITSSVLAIVQRSAAQEPRGSSSPVNRTVAVMPAIVADFVIAKSDVIRSLTMRSPSQPSLRADASPQLVLVIVCAAVALASLDLFIVNVALPQMGRDLHLHGDAAADLSWVLNSYAIVYASLLVLFDRASERYPRERAFLLGVAIFVGASAACGLATSLAMLVAFRVLQAAGAALLTPTSLGLLLAATPAERRHGAVRAWTAVGGFAAALGPVVGGLVVALAGGRELGLGVLRQRADRPCRARRRLAAAATRPRPARASSRRARSG